MRRPTSGEVSVHVDAPPEDVYDLVTDITRMGEWSPETTRCRWVGGASGPEVGARFLAVNRRGWVRWFNVPEVVAADPGREFAFQRTVPLSGTVVWRYGMEREESGTKLTESYDVARPAAGIVNFMTGVLLGVDDRSSDLIDGMRETLAGIKRTAEEAAG